MLSNRHKRFLRSLYVWLCYYGLFVDRSIVPEASYANHRRPLPVSLFLGTSAAYAAKWWPEGELLAAQRVPTLAIPWGRIKGHAYVMGELLWQARPSQDLEEAHQKVLRDYVALKRAALSPEIRRLEEQWGCPFAAFQEQTKDEYTYEVESTLWEWERLETLKSHYQALRERWS